MDLESYKVLMIDDDEMIATATSEYFNMFGVKTSYVTSYADAVAFLEKHDVSLLLLDINLGERSGFELCRKIRENYDLPIFFISARTSDDDVLIALNIGGDDYIKKPYTLSILLAKVKAAVARYDRLRDNPQTVRNFQQTEDGLVKLTGEVYLNTNIRKIVTDGREITLKHWNTSYCIIFSQTGARSFQRMICSEMCGRMNISTRVPSPYISGICVKRSKPTPKNRSS